MTPLHRLPDLSRIHVQTKLINADVGIHSPDLLRQNWLLHQQFVCQHQKSRSSRPQTWPVFLPPYIAINNLVPARAERHSPISNRSTCRVGLPSSEEYASVRTRNLLSPRVSLCGGGLSPKSANAADRKS